MRRYPFEVGKYVQVIPVPGKETSEFIAVKFHNGKDEYKMLRCIGREFKPTGTQ